MKKKEKQEYLSDLEKAAIAQFYAFETMREAVKKVLLKQIYDNGTLKPGVKADPLKNIALVFVSNNLDKPNEVLGENIRSIFQGINALEIGFNELATFQKKDEQPTDENPAV